MKSTYLDCAAVLEREASARTNETVVVLIGAAAFGSLAYNHVTNVFAARVADLGVEL